MSMYPILYATKYNDKFGIETTTTMNDGKSLKMVVRGREFSGGFFNCMKPATISSGDLSRFSFSNGYLCSFSVECGVPITVVIGESNKEARLHLLYENHKVRLGLAVDEVVIKSTGSYGDDEGYVNDELRELENLLPVNTYIKCCSSCSFACQSPLGYSTFGEMGCFRNIKAEYSKVNGKHELIKIFDKVIEYVQEIHLCPEFQPNLKFLHILKSKAV